MTRNNLTIWNGPGWVLWPSSGLIGRRPARGTTLVPTISYDIFPNLSASVLMRLDHFPTSRVVTSFETARVKTAWTAAVRALFMTLVDAKKHVSMFATRIAMSRPRTVTNSVMFRNLSCLGSLGDN